MNTKEITEGGHLSVATFWKVAIPLVVASIVVPVAFSGLLIRTALTIGYKLTGEVKFRLRMWLRNLSFQLWWVKYKLGVWLRDLSYQLWRFKWRLKIGLVWLNIKRKAMMSTSQTPNESSGQAAEGDATESVEMA